MIQSVTIADLFCGAGGSSTGALRAIERQGLTPQLTAVNHWTRAVETHSANHVNARHLCASIDSLNPRSLFADGELNILWGSPECTHHSLARGGRPMQDQSRATAWCVTRWAEALLPDAIFVENVREFEQWGPLDANFKPIKSRKGETFKAWINTLRAIGYNVEWRVLVAADYGAATSRYRLFVHAVRGDRPIVWPTATHSRDGRGSTKWKSTRSKINLNHHGRSVFGRKRPLSPNTMRRIYEGLEEYGLNPTLVCMEHGGRIASIDDPLPTITTAKGGAFAVAEPMLLPQQSGGAMRPVSEPCPTISTAGAIALVEPFLVEYYGTGGAVSIDDPLPTVTSKGRFAICMPDVKVDGKVYKLDILFRMLTAAELAACTGFPSDYIFTGNNTEKIKQIGNAVPPDFADALITSYLTGQP